MKRSALRVLGIVMAMAGFGLAFHPTFHPQQQRPMVCWLAGSIVGYLGMVLYGENYERRD